MKQKVNYVTFNYFKDKPKLTNEEYAVIVQEYKNSRQSKKPKYRKEDRKDDLGGSPLAFPFRYRWTGSKFYDQHWSSIAIGYNELEDARVQAEPARKIMFKMTNANKASEPTMATAVEVWLWTVSCHYEGKVSQFNLKLQDKEPYLNGENDWGKQPLPAEPEEFKKHFLIWLDNFCDIKSKRLTDYFNDAKFRMDEIAKSKNDVFDHIKSLDPPDQYTTLTTISKNILLNDVYYDRAQPLYVDIIERNVGFFQDLQGKWFDILEKVDEMGPTVKGTPMAEILKKHAPGRLFDEEAFLRQKEAKQQKKAEKKSKMWPF